MPRRGRKTLDWLHVPPYRLDVETMLSPAWASVVMAMNWVGSLTRGGGEGGHASFESSDTFLKERRRLWAVRANRTNYQGGGMVG